VRSSDARRVLVRRCPSHGSKTSWLREGNFGKQTNTDKRVPTKEMCVLAHLLALRALDADQKCAPHILAKRSCVRRHKGGWRGGKVRRAHDRGFRHRLVATKLPNQGLRCPQKQPTKCMLQNVERQESPKSFFAGSAQRKREFFSLESLRGRMTQETPLAASRSLSPLQAISKRCLGHFAIPNPRMHALSLSLSVRCIRSKASKPLCVSVAPTFPCPPRSSLPNTQHTGAAAKVKVPPARPAATTTPSTTPKHHGCRASALHRHRDSSCPAWAKQTRLVVVLYPT